MAVSSPTCWRSICTSLKERETIEDKLHRIYNTLEYGEFFENASEQEFKELIPDLREGLHVATPVFDGADEAEIRGFLKEAGVPETGQSTLYDGRTGSAFRSNGYRWHHVHAETPPLGG